jgi:hypothetical protein
MEKVSTSNPNTSIDQETFSRLAQIAAKEKVLTNRISGVKFVLVILSSAGMAFDRDSLRQKIVASYPDAAVFFRNTMGNAIGAVSPETVDLLIDFTSPNDRQGWFYSKKLRKMARFAVGRNSGFFRKKSYDRVFDEKAESASVPRDILSRERYVQKYVLELAGVAVVQSGEVPPDRGKSIALELPPMQRL